MSHPFDVEPLRFGWRYWHLDHTGTKLASPIHKGRLRVGRRFVEADCEHSSDPTRLAPGCDCGIYYVPDADHFSEVFVGFEGNKELDLLVVTFGAAVGEHGPDVVLPEDARRTSRYAVLAIMLGRRSASAGALRQRYGVPVFMRGLGRDVMADVEQAVRAEYRDVDLCEFLEQARSEPVMPLGRHICDEKPHEFGWKVWILGESGALGDVYFSTTAEEMGCHFRTEPALKQFGRRVFVADPGVAVQYTTSARYCYTLMQPFDPWPPTGRPELVATFGMTAGRSTDGGGMGLRHTHAYYPLAMCIPEERADMADIVRRRYGLQVTPSLTMRAMLDAERAVRTRLEGIGTMSEAVDRGRVPALV